MPFATSKGGQIHYSVFDGRERRASGAHTPIVLLQGLGLSSKFWFDIPEALASDREGGRCVITIDNRGTGKSDSGPRRLWTLATMADDVAAVLSAADVEGPAIIAGISMGGMIAQHVALRHPDRVKALLLLATSPGFFFGRLPQASALRLLLSMPFGGKQASRNLAKLLLPESKWDRAKEIFKDWPTAMRDDPTSTRTFAAHLFAAGANLAGFQLAKIRVPTIIVAGASDTLIPIANARALARRIPGAELEVLDDTGHAVFAEDRDLVRRMVVRLERTLST